MKNAFNLKTDSFLRKKAQNELKKLIYDQKYNNKIIKMYINHHYIYKTTGHVSARKFPQLSLNNSLKAIVDHLVIQ